MDNVSILLEVAGVEIPAHPVFGDDVKLKISQEENQVFHRVKIDGKIKFVGSDFDFIESCSHDTKFNLVVMRGGVEFGSGVFLKSDCTLNYDDKFCDVKMTITDRYEKFLASYDNKYNLPKLAPATQSLRMTKRSLLQIYMLGDSKITNYLGNMSFESDATNNAQAMGEAAIMYKGFTKVRPYVVFYIEMSNSDYTYLNGTYYGDITGNSSERIWREDGQYYISFYGGGVYSRTFFTSNGTRVHHGTDDMIGIQFEAGYSHSVGEIIVLTGSGDTRIGWADYYFRNIFARLLTDKSTIPSWADNPIAISSITDDIGENNTSNYDYAVGVTSLSLHNNIIVSLETQNDPTEWGDNGDGKYFVKPQPSSVDNEMFAIGWNMWIPMSFWLEGTPTLYSTIDTKLNTKYDLPDAYPLDKAISKLLDAGGSGVSFSNTSAYSKFLYDTNGLGQAMLPTPVLFDNRYIFITPITNVKKTKYEQAAQRGDITLKQILDMLRNVYQLYWYLDDSNRLCIEHIVYFKHGRNYILGTSVPDVDLTTMKDMPSNLPWAFGTNEVTHRRNLCPSRYEFEWGDECTAQFNGEAIDILDAFVSGDKKEKITVANFTADIDYTVTNPNSVGDDIYAVMEAEKHTSGAITTYSLETPNIRLADDKPVYSMQNGYMSFLYTEGHYWNYDLGGWKARANGSMLEVRDVKRFVEQTVKIPFNAGSMSPSQIAAILTVKTGLGVGSMSEMELQADTLFAKTKILLETEMDYTGFIEVEKVPYSHGSAAWELYNNSYFCLRVKYVEPHTGNINTVDLPPHEYYMTGIGQNTPQTVLLAVDVADSLSMVDLPVISDHGLMQESHVVVSGQIDIVFNGRNSAGVDWGYVKMRTGAKRAAIRIIASTEQNYDKGYAAPVPHVVAAEITTTDTFLFGSGETTSQGTIPANTEFFVGYTKDGSVIGGSDTVTIQMWELDD